MGRWGWWNIRLFYYRFKSWRGPLVSQHRWWSYPCLILLRKRPLKLFQTSFHENMHDRTLHSIRQLYTCILVYNWHYSLSKEKLTCKYTETSFMCTSVSYMFFPRWEWPLCTKAQVMINWWSHSNFDTCENLIRTWYSIISFSCVYR